MIVHVKYYLKNARGMLCLLASTLLIFGIGGNTSVVFKQFTSQPDYFQTTCHEGNNVLFEETKNIIGCLALCAQKANCYTALYNKSQCRGCAEFYASTDPISEGTTHYHRTSVCGDGWRPWNKSCYGISEPGTFQQGQAYCKEEGATAVAVETKSENEFLKQMLRSLEEPGTETGDPEYLYYLGITDDCKGNGEWRQTADGEAISFQDFRYDEPNVPGVECCVALHSYRELDYKWIDIQCQLTMSTICEKQLL